MTDPPPDSGQRAAVRETGEEAWAQIVGRRLGRLFPWHATAFVFLNGALTILNVATGPPWWAVWPLIVTGFALALHYLIYRATAVDEQWVADRVTELNLKSYDRSHIENIKERAEAKAYGRYRDDTD